MFQPKGQCLAYSSTNILRLSISFPGFSTTLQIQFGLPHPLIASILRCVCTHPIDLMGMHLLRCVHGKTNLQKPMMQFVTPLLPLQGMLVSMWGENIYMRFLQTHSIPPFNKSTLCSPNMTFVLCKTTNFQILYWNTLQEKHIKNINIPNLITLIDAICHVIRTIQNCDIWGTIPNLITLIDAICHIIRKVQNCDIWGTSALRRNGYLKVHKCFQATTTSRVVI